MSYGFAANGYNNYTVISSEGKSLVFCGKATRRNNSGDNYYPQDEYAQRKVYYIHKGGNYEDYYSCQGNGVHHTQGCTAYTAYGFYDLRCKGESGCRSVNRFEKIDDNLGYWVYTISGSKSLPTVFINSSDNNYSASVLSITQIGTSETYEIRVIVGFSEGGRGAAESKLTLYCFHKLDSIAASNSFGMELYNKQGELTYSANTHPAIIGDVLSINSITGNTDGVSISAGTLPYPPSSAYTMSKPAVMAVDWCRPREVLTERYYVYNYDSSGQSTGCESTPIYRKLRVTSNYINQGVTFNPSTNTPIISIARTSVEDYQCNLADSETASLNMAWNTIPLPVFMPIVDGALYD